ncbi:MAG TPA: tetratricopeptide repeat protein [Candidatus Baltobacteraceae bacterium]|nr:tetratricopeptide repeat protein [Candidatus Baltobacteraceae bacterium]
MNLTFLFTDVEDGTRLWERAEGTMRRAMGRHDEILQKATQRHGGKALKTVGDAFCCVFEHPRDALRAAVDAQRALSGEPWPLGIAHLRVRMGLHTGDAVLRRGEYCGPTVNRVASLSAAALGDQILVSSVTASLLAADLGDVALRDLGKHRFKELSEPEVVFEVVGPGLRDMPSATPLVEVAPNNLPTQSSTFVGRSEELKRVRDLITLYPLVTIAGMGGIGKTRLALHAAAKVLRNYKDGCWFVALKEIEDSALIAQVAADGMGVNAVEGEPIETTLFEALFKKKCLIVIDNAEHMLSDVANFTRRLLKAVPGIRIIVTSREPLHVGGEHVLRIEGIEESEQLFLDRARALHGDVTLSDATIATICGKLQGIPLAIELAAARLGDSTAKHLDVLLSIAGHPLDATIDWSYSLLNEEEQRFFRRLAVFEGSFSSDAAQKVALEPGSAADGLALLASLVDKSLVFQLTTAHGARYSLLEAVRDFAMERLRDSSEIEETLRRHCLHYTTFVLTTSRVNDKPEIGVSAISVEWNNVRGALHLALEQEMDLEGGRWAVHGLWEFWRTTGRTTEGWFWINRALEGMDVTPRLRTELLQRAAQIASARSDYRALDPLAKLLVEIHERADDTAGLGNALQLLANAKQGLGNGAEAEPLLRRALQLFRAENDRKGIAVSLCNLGVLEMELHSNYDAARQLLQHSFETFKELGSAPNCALALGNLAIACTRAGDTEKALTYARQGLLLYRNLGNDDEIGNAYLNISEIHLDCSRYDEALESLMSAREAWGARPNKFYLACYFELAFKIGVALDALEAAAKIYGYAARFRTLVRVPQSASERASIALCYNRLHKTLGALALDRLTADGAMLEDKAIEGLISSLGPTPKQPSKVS